MTSSQAAVAMRRSYILESICNTLYDTCETIYKELTMFQTTLLIIWVAVATGFSFGPDLRVLTRNISSSKTISKMTNLRVYSSFSDKNRSSLRRNSGLFMSNSESVEPQAISTGYSSHPDLLDAIQEATKVALEGLPSLSRNQIDLGMIHVSSIYDGQYSPTVVIPAILDACTTFYKGIVDDQVLKKLVGCYAGGVIGKSNKQSTTNFTPIENEGGAGVVITMFLLPDTAIRTFHVMEDDVPDDVGRLSPDSWKKAVHLSDVDSSPPRESESTFMLLPSPSFQKDADDFLRGMNMAFGDKATVFGALASTVSSLSRARLFRYDVDEPNCSSILAEGCLGVVFNGDFQAKVMVAQGAKPVGGIYRIISGQGSTVGAIQLDEVATEQLQSFDTDDEDEEEDEESLDEMDVKKRAAAAYAKASIPKPLLAEANYLKGVVFMTFWQSIVISFIAHTVYKRQADVNEEYDATEWSKQAQSFLVCLEMFFFAIVHIFVFPTEEWEPNYKEKYKQKIQANVGDLALKDFFKDVKLVMRTRKKHREERRLRKRQKKINGTALMDDIEENEPDIDIDWSQGWGRIEKYMETLDPEHDLSFEEEDGEQIDEDEENSDETDTKVREVV